MSEGEEDVDEEECFVDKLGEEVIEEVEDEDEESWSGSQVIPADSAICADSAEDVVGGMEVLLSFLLMAPSSELSYLAAQRMESE